jgi:pimeloyl-ACP methyl ester carboxylesterase
MQVRREALTFDVEVAGPEQGRPVLLLHGFPQSARSWQHVTPLLTAEGLRSFAPNQRGYSVGARPAGPEAYAMVELVDDALAMVDAIGVEAIDLVGHDWGAAVAWSVAARHPERVRSLTALSVPHLAAYGAALRSDPEQQRMIDYMLDIRRDPDAADRLLEHDAQRLRAFGGERLPAAMMDEYLSLIGTREGLDGALAWYRSTGRELGALPPVTVPTTFLWGDEDAYIAAAGARACGAQVTGPYRYVELAGVSHWIPEEAPEVVASEILARAAG